MSPSFDALVFDLNGTLWLDCPTRLLPEGPHPASLLVFEELKHLYPLYIVSNCYPHQLEEYLKIFSKNPFKETVYFGKYGPSKEANLKALKNIHQFQKPLYIGDSPSDKNAAMRAGYAFLWAAYTAESFDLPGDKIKSLEDLPRFLVDGF